MSSIVWSVNILLGIGLIGVAWILYYILTLDMRENVHIQNKEDSESN